MSAPKTATPTAAPGCRSPTRPTSTSSSTCSRVRARRDQPRPVARVPPAARHLRPAAGRRCADAARQDPAGHPQRRAARALADVAERYSRGFGHITTRQNIQFHFVKLHDVEPAMRLLAEAGLTTREACGNSVRNITACPYAGRRRRRAVRRHAVRGGADALLAPPSARLDAAAQVQDRVRGLRRRSHRDRDQRPRLAGAASRPRRRERGFTVMVGGGTAMMPAAGHMLFEFLPAARCSTSPRRCCACSTARRLRAPAAQPHEVHDQGARLGRLRDEYERELEAFRAEGGAPLPFDPEQPPVEGAARPCGAAPRRRSPRSLARVASAPLNGPGIIPQVVPRANSQRRSELRRWTRDQRAAAEAGRLRRWSRSPPCRSATSPPRRCASRRSGRGLRRRHRARDRRPEPGVPLGAERATSTRSIAACPRPASSRGDANTRRRRHQLPGRGVVQAGGHAVARPRPPARRSSARSVPIWSPRPPGLDIKISGCPNGCGQHHIATIGFQGSVRKIGGRAVPQYFVMVGGGVADGAASFARHAAKIPARRCAKRSSG